MNVIDKIEKDQMDKIVSERSIPEFGAGDTIKVDVKIIEGDKERIQAFEGLCIARSGSGLNESFTVRKISYGEGVERIFPIFSPKIAGITVLKKGKVRIIEKLISFSSLGRRRIMPCKICIFSFYFV